MKVCILLGLFLRLFLVCVACSDKKYIVGESNKYIKDIDEDNLQNIDFENETPKSNWTGLNERPLPEWYDRAKIGVIIHWGIYSVPSFGSEWFWADWKNGDNFDILSFMNNNYRRGFTYQDFAPLFTAEFFEPEKWVNLFRRAGVKYVILTSKHHDGFTLFPSQRSFSWNSVDVGPHRDLVDELSKAVKQAGLKFGVYYSLYEWYNPHYLEDREHYFSTNTYVNAKVWPDLKQLIENYRPSILWSDGEWENSDVYWNSTEFLRWLYYESPVRKNIVTNDRWGRDTRLRHGDFYTGWDITTPRSKRNHKWEHSFSLDKKSWGYRRNMHLTDIMTANELIFKVVSTVSCGGNALINIGATKEGTIPIIFQELLLALGEFLYINEEAIYDTSPCAYENDTINSNVWYTCKYKNVTSENVTKSPQDSTPKVKISTPESPKNITICTTIYAIFLRWPINNVLSLGSIARELTDGNYKVQMLGIRNSVLKWKVKKDGIAQIQLPDIPSILLNNAWTLKFTKQEVNTTMITNKKQVNNKTMNKIP